MDASMGTVGVRDAGYCIAPDTARVRRSGRPLTENVRGTARGPLVSGVAAASETSGCRSIGEGQCEVEDGPRASQGRARAGQRRPKGGTKTGEGPAKTVRGPGADGSVQD